MVIKCSNAVLTNGAPDRKVQKPPLAMLSGQKSALESIQATGDICTLLYASSPAKAPLRFVKGSMNHWRERHRFLPKAQVTSTAAWDGLLSRESPGALAGRDGEDIYIMKGDTSIFEGF